MSAQTAESLAAFFTPIFLAIVEQALDALPHVPGASDQQNKVRRDVARLLIGALQPTNPEHAAAAAQIVTLHFMAMECFRRAAQPDLADKLMLQFLGKANALLRLHLRVLRDYLRQQGRDPARPKRAAPDASQQSAASRLKDQLNPMPNEPDAATSAAADPHASEPVPSDDRLPEWPHDAAQAVLDPDAAQALHTQTTAMQKTLRQMVANGVTKGFRPGELRALAARAAR